jgi:hypothetical protein
VTEPESIAWLGPTETELEERNSIEFYLRHRRRNAPSAAAPDPSRADGERQPAPGAEVGRLADGDGLTASQPGSGEAATSPAAEPRSVRLSVFRRIRRWLP